MEDNRCIVLISELIERLEELDEKGGLFGFGKRANEPTIQSLVEIRNEVYKLSEVTAKVRRECDNIIEDARKKADKILAAAVEEAEAIVSEQGIYKRTQDETTAMVEKANEVATKMVTDAREKTTLWKQGMDNYSIEMLDTLRKMNIEMQNSLIEKYEAINREFDRNITRIESNLGEIQARMDEDITQE